MSVTGIAASSLFRFLTQSVQSKKQQFQQEFQQLGQDLQSGNMSAAQSDSATLKQDMPQSSSTTTSSAQSGSGIATAFRQLAQDLQSGNLTAARSDYATLQQDFQSASASSQSASGHHHHHHGGDSGSASSAISQLFNELGTARQSGSLSSAQQAYSSLQQDLLQMTTGAATSVVFPIQHQQSFGERLTHF